MQPGALILSLISRCVHVLCLSCMLYCLYCLAGHPFTQQALLPPTPTVGHPELHEVYGILDGRWALRRNVCDVFPSQLDWGGRRRLVLRLLWRMRLQPTSPEPAGQECRCVDPGFYRTRRCVGEAAARRGRGCGALQRHCPRAARRTADPDGGEGG